MPTEIHSCGGTILSGGSSGTGGQHLYCDRCGAYTYDTEGDVPRGTDAAANAAALAAGEEASPP